MPVEDVFSISGRGTVVTGRVERGIIKVGEEIEIVGIKPTFEDHLRAWKCSANCWIKVKPVTTSASCCAAPSVKKSSVVSAGQTGFITRTPTSNAKSTCSQRRRRSSHPFFNNYRPQFYFRTTDVTGSVTLPAGTEMVMPGDNVKMTVALIAPIAMEEKLRFAIREGGRTVGAGVVSKIIKQLV